LFGAVVLGSLLLFRQQDETPSFSVASRETDAVVHAAYAGSATCRDCHEAAFAKWAGSHHALAERDFDLSRDSGAFEPSRQISPAGRASEARLRDGRCELATEGASGFQAFVPDRIIGVAPLVQYLIPVEGGRWQTAELSFDPAKGEWFDVFGEEDRRPGEWGHWTGRGMNWNSMCASCHNTRLRKNYDPLTDSYRTSMAEMGVGCEACHGPMKDHVTWQQAHRNQKEKDPTLRPMTRDQMLDTCGMCHARRGELTGDFAPGEKFSDHFTLSIPDETDIYYADGQVRDENYEFTAFLGSRMHAAGVRCGDCHEPHSAKTILQGDSLCMRCHEAPIPPAPKIDAAAHSFHKPGTSGSACVDCHMPLTTYMQRHPRRDHGFTIPDPLLTKEHGIPNACNRCHADRSVDWSVEAAERWHGPKMNRPSRERARLVARARAGATTAPGGLMRLLASEPIGLWRASAARLLAAWNHEPQVWRALAAAARDTNALVRANAAHALEGAPGAGRAEIEPVLRALTGDPVRSVRVEAAWSGRAWLDTNSLAATELARMLEENADQPGGLHQLGVWHLERGDSSRALELFRRVADWDGGSAPFRQSLALALSMLGHAGEAVEQLQVACRLAPQDAVYPFQLGLALTEAGRAGEAIAALERAVQLDGSFGLACYNLGLAYAQAEDLERAAEILFRAEALQPGSPRASYALATVLLRMGRAGDARAAAERALVADPAHLEASELLRSLR
jgi:Flp pilus assembly protein TadD